MMLTKTCVECGGKFRAHSSRLEWVHCSVPCRRAATQSRRLRQPTQAMLQELILYEPNTGELYWRATGRECGWLDSGGYRHIRVHGKLYLAHRIAWLYVYGRLPTSNLDHINGTPADNRLVNLREATQALNCRNVKPIRSNSSLRSGVNFDNARKKFRAYITIAGRQKFLGRFDSLEAALMARRKGEELYFGDYRRGVLA